MQKKEIWYPRYPLSLKEKKVTIGEKSIPEGRNKIHLTSKRKKYQGLGKLFRGFINKIELSEEYTVLKP